MSARPHVILAATAGGLEAAAAGVVLGLNNAQALLVAGALHALAAHLSLLAGHRRRKDLSQVEGDIVFVTALLVPIFGPPMAWAIPRAVGGEVVESAPEVFDRYAKHVKPHVPDYERTLFTGDYERDLARELDAESYHEVLRHGSTDQKRNALRRLAELGDRKHFQLIRSCLLDLEHEVRLYAYSELERAAQPYEREIGERSRQLAKKPDDGESLLSLARAYFDYAVSGIHDDEMAAFYYQSAQRFALRAQDSGFDPVAPVLLRAGALARLREYEQAEACLATLDEAGQRLPETCLVRADLAYRRRDFDRARAEAAAMREAGADLPAWLEAMEAKR